MPAAAGVVAYFGGRVLSNVAVVAVLWTGDVDLELSQRIGPCLLHAAFR